MLSPSDESRRALSDRYAIRGAPTPKERTRQSDTTRASERLGPARQDPTRFLHTLSLIYWTRIRLRHLP